MSEYSIDDLLKKAVELNASDVHITTGEVPSLRINGIIRRLNIPAVSEKNVIEYMNKEEKFSLNNKNLYDYDFSYEIKDIARFRVNLAKSFGRYSLTIRIIPTSIPKFEQLGLPERIKNFAELENGIVLVTGVTGSGKSTTIASILDYINERKRKHILTIEDPIEYVYTSKKSIFTQRQIGLDTQDFISGLKYAMRQDPDIILVGEIRDIETVRSALYAAETGHLVLSTLHTIDAVQTFHRILGFFPPSEREAIRNQLSEVYRGSISQRLLLNADNNGRVPAVEILFSTPTIKDFFIKDNLEEVYNMVKQGSYDGMLTFNMSLAKLYQEGKITKETAIEYSDNQNELIKMIR